MNPSHEIGGAKLYTGDSLQVLRTFTGNSVDSIVTDPPYGLRFMGRRWDYDVPSVELFTQCLRVLKPGGYLLAFAGTRTQHRMAVRIEDAGFEIRDMIAWVYGSGFPKSRDVSKAIDSIGGMQAIGDASREITAPSTEAAKQWCGWGTALKPALEPITVARKPVDGTVAENVLAHGTGALNIDGCRVGHDGKPSGRWGGGKRPSGFVNVGHASGSNEPCGSFNSLGRWPANFIHDGSDEVLGLFPDSKGQAASVGPQHGDRLSVNAYGDYGARSEFHPRNDSGSAARFFYCAKASRAERSSSLSGERNTHPTVKPTDLMQYLCRLVTPLGGVVLDPFSGSGSTLIAALLEGFKPIGIELSPAYQEIAADRLRAELLPKSARPRIGTTPAPGLFESTVGDA